MSRMVFVWKIGPWPTRRPTLTLNDSFMWREPPLLSVLVSWTTFYVLQLDLSFEGTDRVRSSNSIISLQVNNIKNKYK